MSALRKSVPTAAQLRAALHRTSPVLMISGPGAGKTETLARRYRERLANGLASFEIFACAYTNEAANNFRSRVGVARSDREAWIGTVHALACRILRRKPAALGLRERFEVLDRDRALRLMDHAMQKTDHPRISDVANASQAAGELLDFATKLKTIADGQTGAAAWLACGVRTNDADRHTVEAYIKLCRDSNVADFDDLLLGGRLALAGATSGMKSIIVDEYQDLSPLALAFIDGVVGDCADFIAAADVDQTIFAWRGASADGVNNFKSRHPQARIMALGTSFRLPPGLLEPAMTLVSHNSDRLGYDLVSGISGTAQIDVKHYANDGEERRGIAQRIRAMVDAGAKPESIAVFARTHALATSLASAIAAETVPVSIDEDLPLTAPGLSGFVAVCRLARGSFDPSSFEDAARDLTTARDAAIEQVADWLVRTNRKRVEEGRPPLSYADALRRVSLPDGGPKSADRAELRQLGSLIADAREALESAKPPFRTVFNLLLPDMPDVADVTRVRDLVEFLDTLVEDIGSVDEAMGSLSLARRKNQATRSVRVMTLHAAKGLEFEHGIIAGFEEGLLPFGADEARVSEERRLAFVGMTRASKSLRITAAGCRKGRPVQPSRFLADAGLQRERERTYA